MGGLIMAGQLLLSLTLLVVIHELGHFLAARMFGIKVTKFFIFFDAGFKIWSKKIGDTEFGFGWLPLGGYVKIAGMIDESMDTEQMKQEPKEWEFRSKPAWQRLIVMLAGVFMNVIAGILILSFSHMVYTKEYLPVKNVEQGIYAYPYARYLGFETGDKIIAIDGKSTQRYEDVFSSKLFFAKSITVERYGQTKEIAIPDTLYSYLKNGGLFISLDNFSFSIDSCVDDMPISELNLKKGSKILSINREKIKSFGQLREILHYNKNRELSFVFDNNGKIDSLDIFIDSTAKLGIYASSPTFSGAKYNFGTALLYGWKDAFETVNANIKGYGLIFSGKEKVRESLQGPIGIAKVYGAVWDWAKFWRLTGIISMILAFINILPIPALDGGHALFLVIEVITGRKLSDKFMGIVQIIGMLILLALMVFVIGNDIINLF
ncbi:MAG TPA: RIP metalloprotease RseP [Bacteroidales bacterium]|nr:RIP metalloprotease RseP [Bacteroidales bacterium]HOR60484.1 RIP metalloprotease RseP [Bacteroidales bacterium]HPL04901.1 RIP metalloprotease RseP [Bacteroidales bacterium]